MSPRNRWRGPPKSRPDNLLELLARRAIQRVLWSPGIGNPLRRAGFQLFSKNSENPENVVWSRRDLNPRPPGLKFPARLALFFAMVRRISAARESVANDSGQADLANRSLLLRMDFSQKESGAVVGFTIRPNDQRSVRNLAGLELQVCEVPVRNDLQSKIQKWKFQFENNH